MQVTLKKWGNSIGLRIPAGLLAETGLGENSTVEMTVEDGKIIISPEFRKTWKYTLEQLLDEVTEENLHLETDWGTPRGEEVW